jgi:CelD/BcsL family acetyltransferase involved in cellulose biosynthesis
MDSAMLSSPCSLKTETCSDPAAFEQLAAEWDDLLENSAQQVYFLRHHWNLLWWQHYAPVGSRLHILCCRDQHGRLMGIAPFYWRRHLIAGIPYVRELSFIGTGIELKTSEYLDVIARRGYERDIAEALAAHLKGSRQWDRIWMNQLPAESMVLPHLARALGARATTSLCDRAPYIDTSSDWETYKHELGRSMRRNVEYYARRLFKRYPCEFACARTPTEMDAALKALVQLHQARWQARGHLGSFAHPAFERLISDAAHWGIEAGRTRLWTLKINGVIEAALVGFLDAGVLHYFQKGFNPTYASEDLGTAMLSLCIRASFEDPAIRAFDFMGGGAPYKDLWARTSRETRACNVARVNVRTHVYALREKIRHTSVTLFRAVAPKFLRDARRDYLHASRLKRHARTLNQHLWFLLVPLLCCDSGRLSLLTRLA